MDSIYETSLLLDFYGQLLTEKQYSILDLYYNNDYSLAEIAENFGISRQGVYDNIKRSKASLSQYEAKLGLVHKFVTSADKARKAQGLLRDIDNMSLTEQDRVKLGNVIEIIDKLAEEKE